MTPESSPDHLLEIFERMLLMRRFEETVMKFSEEKHFFGHFHVYIGQEATGATVLDALEPTDLVLTTHRNHGHIVGRGADPGKALAEIMGRADGFNGGRGGTLHLCDRSTGFLSTSAVVGGAIGLSLGAAYHLKRTVPGGIVVAFFGDGALEEGISLEALNIAALYKLPIFFVCENNSPGAAGAAAGEYPSSEMAAVISSLPKSFRIPTAVVDGESVSDILETVSEAMRRLRTGKGPFFIEAITERWPGSKPLWPEAATGVTDLTLAWAPEKIEGPEAGWIKNHDCVLKFIGELLSSGLAERDDILKIDGQIAEKMAAACNFALASPNPDPATVNDYIFA
jgi:TPP-dependent pyruvate/acetoin dehydrogenase alpha subunit